MSDETEDIAEMAAAIRDRIDEKIDNGTSRPKAIFFVIETLANDACLAHSVIRKTARAADASEERMDELCTTLARCAKKCDRDEVRNRAAYYGSTLKRLVSCKWQVPWDEERPPNMRIHRAG
jgi:hypothetical protein